MVLLLLLLWFEYLRAGLSSVDSPQTCYVAKNGLELLPALPASGPWALELYLCSPSLASSLYLEGPFTQVKLLIEYSFAHTSFYFCKNTKS